MKQTLRITNSSGIATKARILYAINHSEPNFGLPEGIKIELVNANYTYKKLLAFLMMESSWIQFFSSTNNRQLFFGWMDMTGMEFPIEPQKNKDGTLRKRVRGQKFKVGKDVIYEGDMFVNWFTKEWKPKKWNIADTHERGIWTFFHFIDLYLKPNQVFELEFMFIQ